MCLVKSNTPCLFSHEDVFQFQQATMYSYTIIIPATINHNNVYTITDDYPDSKQTLVQHYPDEQNDTGSTSEINVVSTPQETSILR